MRVKDLKNLLEGKEDDAQVYLWTWHGSGSQLHHLGGADAEDGEVQLVISGNKTSKPVKPFFLFDDDFPDEPDIEFFTYQEADFLRRYLSRYSDVSLRDLSEFTRVVAQQDSLPQDCQLCTAMDSVETPYSLGGGAYYCRCEKCGQEYIYLSSEEGNIYD